MNPESESAWPAAVHSKDTSFTSSWCARHSLSNDTQTKLDVPIAWPTLQALKAGLTGVQEKKKVEADIFMQRRCGTLGLDCGKQASKQTTNLTDQLFCAWPPQ